MSFNILQNYSEDDSDLSNDNKDIENIDVDNIDNINNNIDVDNINNNTNNQNQKFLVENNKIDLLNTNKIFNYEYNLDDDDDYESNKYYKYVETVILENVNVFPFFKKEDIETVKNILKSKGVADWAINGVGTFRWGGLWRDVFTGISGSTVSNLTSSANYPAFPAVGGAMTNAESPSNYADNYGQRWSGWITPPQTGNYRFYIACDDAAGGHGDF
jgi:hypothetical protein